MTDNEINTIKTDIALIKRDITQISHVYRKVDDTLEQMSEITKTLAVQEKTLENDARRITILEENFMKHNIEQVEFRKDLNKKLEEMMVKIESDRDIKHTQMLNAIDKMSKTINHRLDEQDKRITALENWKWYIAGITAVVMFVAGRIPWMSLFTQ